MWPQKKLHFSSTSISISLLIAIPLVLILVVVLSFNPQSYSFSPSWKPFAFFSSNSSSLEVSADHGHDISIHVRSLSLKTTFSKCGISSILYIILWKKRRKEQERLERSEATLAKMRSSIREASGNKVHLIKDQVDDDHYKYIPQGLAYWNANAFLRSYEETERLFKIYVYEEGELPIFHNGPCRSIYSTKGNLMYEIERSGLYRTRDPMRAHVFFLPFSVVGLVQYLYEPKNNDRDAIEKVIADYVSMVFVRHPFWNSSLGADHFILSCHDLGPFSTKHVPNLFHNSIRVLCNANTSEGSNPLKDASLPEINLKTRQETEGLLVGAPSPLQHPFLTFFAGGLHGHIRHFLLKQWKGKDPQILVRDNLPTNVSYEYMLRSSRFCLCPLYEVASPRVVEVIYSECVLVFISDGYMPSLSNVLNWSEFSDKHVFYMHVEFIS